MLRVRLVFVETIAREVEALGEGDDVLDARRPLVDGDRDARGAVALGGLARASGGAPPGVDVERRRVAETDDAEEPTACARDRDRDDLAFTAVKPLRRQPPAHGGAVGAAREGAQRRAAFLVRREQHHDHLGRRRRRVPSANPNLHRAVL